MTVAVIEWLKEGNTSKARPSTVCDKTCLCVKGSKDRFCSLCEDGYFKQGMRCHVCPKTKTSVYVLVALVVLTMVLLKGGFHDSAHVRESKFFSSPLHAVTRTQATSLNCIVNAQIGSELIARA